MAEVPSTHYVKSDDVYIAYQVLGEGSLDLIFVPGFVSNVEAMWQSPNRSRFLRRLASFCRVIIFDKRGTGMSDRGSQIFTLEQRTSALVLYGTYAKRSWSPDYPFGWTDEKWNNVLDNIEHHWGTPQGISVTMWAPSIASDPRAVEGLASYFRASASPGAAAAIMRMNREIDVRHILPATRVPTLILHQSV